MEKLVKIRFEKYSERFDKGLSVEDNIITWGKRSLIIYKPNKYINLNSYAMGSRHNMVDKKE